LFVFEMDGAALFSPIAACRIDCTVMGVVGCVLGASSSRFPHMASWVWAVWGIANLVGGALLAVPDAGPRLFSISRTHGPSAVDAVGAAVLLAGWVTLDAAVLKRFDVLRRASKVVLIGAAATVITGLAILVPTIAFDLGWWWIVGVALLAGVQLVAAIWISRHAST
jgi:hypothetical protein